MKTQSNTSKVLNITNTSNKIEIEKNSNHSETNNQIEKSRIVDMEKKVKLKIKRLHEDAILPSKGSKSAAGFDLRSLEESVVPANSWKLIKTGIAIQFEPCQYARIAPRSGLALKQGIDVGAGVVDADQTGEVNVILFNHSTEDFVINKDDRIAQLILQEIPTNVSIVKIEDEQELEETERGQGGFGSTGINNK